MGCYEDQDDRTMEKNIWWYSDTNSPHTCGEACRDYKYFSNQNGGECWCSNTLKREIKKPESDCNKRCPGDNTKFCGAGFRNSVYQREAQGNNSEITALPIHVNGSPHLPVHLHFFAAKECWEKCGEKSGPCDHFCGSASYCCRQGTSWIDGGCDGKVGGANRHECSSMCK